MEKRYRNKIIIIIIIIIIIVVVVVAIIVVVVVVVLLTVLTLKAHCHRVVSLINDCFISVSFVSTQY